MRQMEVMGWGEMENNRSGAPMVQEPVRKESLAEVAHDVRNLVSALDVYCDLLEEPGVLAAPFAHYGKDLRMVATASRQLVEKLAAAESRRWKHQGSSVLSPGVAFEHEEKPLSARMTPKNSWSPLRWEPMLSEPIENLAEELVANRNLLAALAGPAISLTVDAQGGALPVLMTGEELTRVLVNLVKNAAEAMPGRGRIAISLHELTVGPGLETRVLLSVEDSGPGIPGQALEKIFEPGYSTRASAAAVPTASRGLGLSSSHSIVEAAGGKIRALNRTSAEPGTKGARFEIELPVRNR
jgi:signal transduction histidine kinase